MLLKVSTLLLLTASATSEPPIQGYNYPTPAHPANGYLPVYSSHNDGYSPPSPHGLVSGPDYGSQDHHHDHQVPKSYEFGYSVKDSRSGNDYGRRERSDGREVRGEYRVQLPDGRTQIVTYHADWKTGFHADVRYEGQARYPEPEHQSQGYNYNAPPEFTGSLTGFHNNNNNIINKPAPVYGPPYH